MEEEINSIETKFETNFETRFSLLPIEIIYKILNKLPYTEMLRLRSVCIDWNDILNDLHPNVSWEVLGERSLELIMDRDQNNVNELYNWFLHPSPSHYKYKKNEYLSLPRMYGMEMINYTLGTDDVIENCPYYDKDDSDDIISKKRRRWTQHKLINEIGRRRFKIIAHIGTTFLEERLKIFNETYPLQLKLHTTTTPLIIAKRFKNGEFRVQFTSDGFMGQFPNYREHDFKMFKYPSTNNPKSYLWEGLGDNWETMSARHIIETFKPSKTNQGIKLKLLCLNEASMTISHLLEAIIYLTEQKIDGKTIPWEYIENSKDIIIVKK